MGQTESKKVSPLDAIAEKLLPVAAAIGSNRYLCAIRDGYISVMPLVITASLFTLINSVVLGDNGFTKAVFGNPFTDAQQLGSAISSASMSVLGLLLAFTTSKTLAKHYGMDTSIASTTAIVCFLTLTPFVTDEKIGEYVTTGYLSSTGMFTAFITAILAVELYRFLAHFDALIIKMPDGVPAGIARSINSIIPVALTIIIFGLVRVATNIIGAPVNDLITVWLQTPVLSLVSSPVGLVVIYFFYMLLWGFGIHTASIMNGILEPLYLINLTANANAVAAGQAATNVMTKPFLDAVAFMGGAGNMLALIIAIFIVSRRADYRTIAKVGLVPSLFNISEPIMFGLPVVMNPILIIPMILVTLAGLGIGALSTVMGFMGYTYALTPWITPPLIGAFLSTGGSIGAVVTAAVILVVSVLIYMPFVEAMNKATDAPVETEEA